MITTIFVLLLSLIIITLALTFSFSIIGLIIISLPVIILIGYLNGSLEINGKIIKPFYIK